MQSRRKNLKKETEAQVGIGTMIVFIATVLVAAIAAGVLITTSSDLQEKSSRTGKEATEQVASNLAVESVIGHRTGATGGLEDMDVYLSLAPGASQVDLSQLRVQISDGAVLRTLQYATGGGVPAGLTFTTVEVRDVDGSFDDAGSSPVMSAGDLVYLRIAPDDALVFNAEIDPRAEISMSLLPELGNSVPVGFTTPNSYGTNNVVQLV